MLKFPAEDFIGTLTVVSDLAGRLDSESVAPAQIIPAGHGESIKPILTHIKELATELELPVSVRLTEKILQNLSGEYTVRHLRRGLSELKNRLIHEIELSPLIYRIERANLEYLKDQPFGPIVAEQFPSSIIDIEEAAKCLAYERSSACVMHLAKIVESALTAFITYSQLPTEVIEKLKNRDANWGNIMTPMREEFRDRDSKHSWPEGVDSAFCQSVRAFGDSVRVAWRNPAMHFGRAYSHEEAVDIYHAVKGFMRTLAAKVHESGRGTVGPIEIRLSSA